MKKRKGSRARRMAAVLLSAMLMLGMLADAVPASVLAQESVSENTPANGETEPVEGKTEPAEETDSEEPETTEPAEETETASVSENDTETEPVEKPQRVTRAAAPQADNIASGTDWVLDKDGKLTITSDAGMADWTSNRNTYKERVTSVEIKDGVTGIELCAFEDCKGLKSITIPESVTSIDANALMGCRELAEITIPKGVTSIRNSVFSGCIKLTKITMHEDVTSIGVSAFMNCVGLTEITIPEGVMSIGDIAFSGNRGLTKITIPDSVTSIGRLAFDNCTSLEEVIVKGGTPPELGSDAFGHCKFVTGNKQGIHVPKGTLTAYQEAAGWKDYEDHITDGTTSAEEHEHNGVTFTAWTKTNSLPTDAGNYYLTENVELTDIWAPEGPGEIRLCLNGKTLSISKPCVITNGRGSTLSLYDCQNNGNITGGRMAGVENQGTFQMYGGKISGNGSFGVENQGIFEMYGGEISGNNVQGSLGSGVYTRSGKFIVGGDAVISGNTADGKVSNVYLEAGQTIEIDSSNPLSGSARIGVTTKTAPTAGNPVDITGHNKGDYSKYFTSDNQAYEIVDNNNVVQLAVKSQTHTHNLTPMPAKDATCTEDGNKAYYVCGGCGKWFLDAAGTQEITNHDSVVIPAAGHSYDESAWGYQGADGHAHKCRNCDAHDTVQAHTPGAAATKKTPQTCTVCGYVIKKATGGGSKPGGGSGGGSGSGDDQNGDNGGAGDNSGGDNGGAGGNPGDGSNLGGAQGGSGSGSGNPGGTGVTAGKPGTSGSSGTGQPRVKQEKKGNIQKEVSVTGESTLDAAVVTPLSALSDIVLTESEKQQVAAGTTIRIVLDVKDVSAVISPADKKIVETALNGSLAKGYTLGQYLDISLYKVVGNSRNSITNTNGKLTVTIGVPDSLKNTDSTKTRTFAVIRVHDGRAVLLTDLDNVEDTITIETDRFSTYAIVYKDSAGSGNSADAGAVRVSVKNDSSPNGVRVSEKNGGNKKPGGRKDDEPDTGDHTPIELGATLSMIAGLTYLLFYFADRRRGMTEETKRELVSRLVGWAKQGGRIRRWFALAAIFVLLVYYHSVGKKTCVGWEEIKFSAVNPTESGTNLRLR